MGGGGGGGEGEGVDETLWGEGIVGGGLTEIEGNAHPAYFRLTCGAIPDTQSLKSRWHLPLGAVVQPLAPTPAGVSERTRGITSRLRISLLGCCEMVLRIAHRRVIH